MASLYIERKISLLFPSKSGLDETQVKESFNAFVAEHPDGKMKPKDFREMMSKALPKKDVSKMEKHVFRIYDSNNDGYRDFSEFIYISSSCQMVRQKKF